MQTVLVNKVRLGDHHLERDGEDVTSLHGTDPSGGDPCLWKSSRAKA